VLWISIMPLEVKKEVAGLKAEAFVDFGREKP
jgi:hypothetical protein